MSNLSKYYQDKRDKEKAYAKILEVFRKGEWKHNSFEYYIYGDFKVSFHPGDSFNFESFRIYYKGNLVTFLSFFQEWRLKGLFKKYLKNKSRRDKEKRDNKNIKILLETS